MNKVRKFEHQGRFAVISEYRSHIIIYAILGGLVCTYTFVGFSISRMQLLLLAGVISILYTLPIFGKSMRLRDFSFIKIFLIAFVWSVVTESIPLYEAGIDPGIIALLFFERVCFFVAITIPFDIRDIDVDRTNNVKTIPSTIGKTKSIILSVILLTVSIVFEIYLSRYYNLNGFLEAIMAYATTAILIVIVKDKTEDYYFSGIIDATIMLPLIFYYIFK